MGNEVAKRQNGMVELRKTLDTTDVKKQFENALKANASLFMASIVELVSSDTTLQQCNPNDIVREALKAAVLKLPINKQLGFAFIVPFRDHGVMKPTFILGYKGIIQLAIRTGKYKYINTGEVYDGMIVRRDIITGEAEIIGTPKNNKIMGYFAYIGLLNGFRKLLYETKAKIIEHAKKYSKSYNSEYSPWTTEFDKMARKTVLRELLGTYGAKSVDSLNFEVVLEETVADPETQMIELENNNTVKEIADSQQGQNEGPGF